MPSRLAKRRRVRVSRCCPQLARPPRDSYCWWPRRTGHWRSAEYCVRHYCWPLTQHLAVRWPRSCFGWRQPAHRWFAPKHWLGPPRGKGWRCLRRHWVPRRRLGRSLKTSPRPGDCFEQNCDRKPIAHGAARWLGSWSGWSRIELVRP